MGSPLPPHCLLDWPPPQGYSRDYTIDSSSQGLITLSQELGILSFPGFQAVRSSEPEIYTFGYTITATEAPMLCIAKFD